MQLLALIQLKSFPSATTTLDSLAATPATSQGVPPPSVPPSTPLSVPELPQVIPPPVELPSSVVGQAKGKQHADELPQLWDSDNVDMDMGGEEDLYNKDVVDVDTNYY
ncbi:hypothetical protein PAXRUDRAFT_16689 [Paxillus rubicundulus Ve08.2h10]|uniref:Uncharacterized protein n=1 Tax=Paxillus rubicundulus Ve08.2h10 TaxID=930991 RepID=A0A0D0D557_9AGAM|nr:hypothetical protein PAXRUDRAFT_16689 [Paxillus rubicundulus Ve08.2h10]